MSGLLRALLRDRKVRQDLAWALLKSPELRRVVLRGLLVALRIARERRHSNHEGTD